MEAIKKYNEGKEELANIINEENKYKDGKGGKAGNFVKDIWEKDRESSFKDQRENGEFHCNQVCLSLCILAEF